MEDAVCWVVPMESLGTWSVGLRTRPPGDVCLLALMIKVFLLAMYSYPSYFSCPLTTR